MPSTKDATLDLIRNEINEVAQREKELRQKYQRSESSFEHTDISLNAKPPLERAKSVSTITNGTSNRLFTQNVTTKGVMHRFFKSRGRLSVPNNNNNNNTIKTQPPENTWNNLAAELTKPVVPPGTRPRNGFVSVEERIKREFQDMHQRETELRSEREKSQPDLLAILNSSPEPQRRSLRAASVLQLNDYNSYGETISAPASLKGAKSLSDLCDIDAEEEIPPGSHSLIEQWESLIKRNQS